MTRNAIIEPRGLNREQAAAYVGVGTSKFDEMVADGRMPGPKEIDRPKDGTAFAVIEHGSTGIFRAVYSGKWPDGHLLYQDCVGHPKGCMWKPLEKLNDQESERLRLCDESHKKFMEREMVFFGSMTDEAQT